MYQNRRRRGWLCISHPQNVNAINSNRRCPSPQMAQRLNSAQSRASNHSVGVGALPCPSHCCRCSILFREYSFKSSIRFAGPSAGSQLIVNSSRWRQLKEYINYLFLMCLYLAVTWWHHREDLLSPQAIDEWSRSRQLTRPWRPAPTHWLAQTA